MIFQEYFTGSVKHFLDKISCVQPYLWSSGV